MLYPNECLAGAYVCIVAVGKGFASVYFPLGDEFFDLHDEPLPVRGGCEIVYVENFMVFWVFNFR